jgi:hypothetical protein
MKPHPEPSVGGPYTARQRRNHSPPLPRSVVMSHRITSPEGAAGFLRSPLRAVTMNKTHS